MEQKQNCPCPWTCLKASMVEAVGVTLLSAFGAWVLTTLL